MALCALSGDALNVIFETLCNVLDPQAAECSSASRGLHAATQAFREQLLEDHEAATALSIKLGVPSCKTLREIPVLRPNYEGLSDDDLALLGRLVSVLPSLEILFLTESSTGPNGVQRLAAGLGAGALPAMTYLGLSMHVGDAGASALAAALDRGAMPQLKKLALPNCGLSDAGLMSLVPALRARPALESLNLAHNPIRDRSIVALVARAPPPPPLSAAHLQAIRGGVLPSLTALNLGNTEISDDGCSALHDALVRIHPIGCNGLAALKRLNIVGIPASAERKRDLVRLRTLPVCPPLLNSLNSPPKPSSPPVPNPHRLPARSDYTTTQLNSHQ